MNSRAATVAARFSQASLYFAVALGSAVGGTVRWLISAGLQDLPAGGFPWGTLFVNVTGSLLIGFYAALAGPGGRLFPGPRHRHFVMTGLCGGYTTFSIFSLEALQLAGVGRGGPASLYLGVSLAGWLVAAWIGYALATRINRLKRS